MPYEVLLEHDKRILRVNLSGQLDISERRAVVVSVLARAAHEGIDRLLLDYRRATAFIGDDASNQALAKYLSDGLDHSSAKLAYLLTHDHQLSPDVERLARDLGLASQRFHDLDAAFAWLEQVDAGMLGAPPVTASPLRRALALSMSASDPNEPLPSVQFAGVVKLVQELLDAGIEETMTLGLARRTFEVISNATPAPMPDAHRSPPPSTIAVKPS